MTSRRNACLRACSAAALARGTTSAAGVRLKNGSMRWASASPAHAGAQILGGAVAEHLHRELLSLPCSCGLSEAAQERVIDVVRESLGA